MNTSTDDERMRRARALFEAQVEALDGVTATALRARRREALASARPSQRALWWWPASGIATAALAVVIWLPRGDGLGTEGVDANAAIASADAARFADGALVELENDAAFYVWLAEAPTDGAAPGEAPANDDTGTPAATPNEGWML